MKIFDCFMFYDEDLLLDLRLNILDQHVDFFVIVESKYFHNGKERQLKFDIKKYKQFENKIIYIVHENEPAGIHKVNKEDDEGIKSYKLITNAHLRENEQRNQISRGLNNATDNDLILISDVDEIPNFESIKLEKINNQIIMFEQSIFYYKLNRYLPNFTWYGTKGCKKKDLLTFAWLREVKARKYPFLRLDTFFSKTKYNNIKIVENGGWHFSQLKTPKDIEIKLMNQEHHDEYKIAKDNLPNVEDLVKRKTIVYDHKAKSSDYKYSKEFKLKTLSIDYMPKFLQENVSKYSNWFDL